MNALAGGTTTEDAVDQGAPASEAIMAKSAKAAKADRLTAVVKVQIAKPLDDVDWRELGERLMDLRGLVHRACNRAITDMLILDHQRRLANLARPQKAKPEPGVKAEETKETALRTVASRGAKESIDDERVFWASQIDKRRAAVRRATDKKERAILERDLATAIRRAEMTVTCNFADSIGNVVAPRYARWRKTSLRGDTSLPTFRAGAAIPFRDRDFSLDVDERGYVLTLTLGPRDRVRMAVVPSGGSAHAQMREIMREGSGWKTHDLEIVSKGNGKSRKWYAHFVYSKPLVKKERNTSVAVAVHLGIKNAITVCSSEGDGRIVDSGSRLLHVKAQFHQRRIARGGGRRNLGAAARGHGETRRWRGAQALRDAEARFVKTTCEQWASAVVRWAEKVGAGVLLVEDYSSKEFADAIAKTADPRSARLIRNWPFAQLRGAIEWAATKAGSLEVRVVPSRHESTRCPKCGTVDAANNQGHGVFLCVNPACELKRNVDTVAAWNLCAAAGFGRAFERAEAKSAALGEALRQKKKRRGKAQEGAPG